MSHSSRLERSVSMLLRLNQRGDTPAVRALLATLVFAGTVALLTLYGLRSGGLDAPPPLSGDAASYDSLGWELARGRGFSLQFADPDFIEPYAQVDPVAAGQLAESPMQGPISRRPPLLPFVMAGLNRALGRQFHGVRAVNITAIALVAALIAWTVCRLAGPVPGLLGVIQFLIVDPRARVTSYEILTESLACVLIAALTLTLVRLAIRPRLSTAALAGGIIGLAMLDRTMFVLWIPVIAVLIWQVSRVGTASRAALIAAFFVAASVVFAPWGYRNCRVLDRCMPLGTQGTIELSAGYSEAAFDHRGMWHNLEQAGFFDAVDRPGQSAFDRELARADLSRSEALAWCRAFPWKAALLPAMKVLQEFRPHMSGDLYILAFALLGLAWARGAPEGRVWTAILVATAFGVALTWSVAGRFVVPALYVLHCAAAVGVWNAIIASTVGRGALDAGRRTPAYTGRNSPDD